VLREPALPADEFDVLKRARTAAIEQSRTEPGAVGPRWLQRELNPYSKEDVRYVPTVEESLERLKSATHAQVEQLYREYLGSQAGELTIVGDFDQAACLPILKATFAGWKVPKPYARIAMPITREVAGAQHQLNTPDKANATYAAGIMFPLRDDAPDYPAMLIGNYIFGSGALSSRLGDRIRQKEGLSYGVSSSLSVSPFDQRSVLTVAAICNPRNIDRLEKAAREELERLVRDGVTQSELDQARRGYLEARIVARSSDPALAGLLNTLRHENRTMEFEAALENNIRALTPDQVSAAWRTHIDPNKLVVVAAGDFEPKPTPVPARTE